MSALSHAALRPLSCWQSMSVERYAAFEAATGVSVARIGGIWWQEVRPFLYRPLLPFKKYDGIKVKQEFDRWGCFQAAVKEGQFFNSYLNPVVFDRPQDYDTAQLHLMVRRRIKKAISNLISVSRFVDAEQFSECGYPVYLSFYKRTHYGFDKSRKEKDKFIDWARTLFRFPEAIILGAYAGGELVCFEIACVVENALVLKTLVTSDKSLALGAPDLLLDHYRTGAREDRQIDVIYNGMLLSNQGLNNYKIIRGAKVLALPSFLNLWPGVRWVIGKGSASTSERLHGVSPQQLAAGGLWRTDRTMRF